MKIDIQDTNIKKNIYIETYGCQMNVSDTEIIASIMKNGGYNIIRKPDTADVIFLNTCSVRENAENTIFNRLNHLNHFKKKNNKLVVGILGCMAERLQNQLVEQKDIVSLVVGPDEYRNLPALVENAFEGKKGIAVELSRVETYDDIPPLRTDGISAWISIMRGCDKYCSYCVVPFTRGRERSRPMQSIVEEVKRLSKNYKEITLLGQNVNSYKDKESKTDFADLLIACAEAAPQMRIRYTTSHPRDMRDKLIEAHAAYKNICNHIHLPVQSGSSRILKLMNRSYNIEHYLGRIEMIKKLLPDCTITTDIIAGFCTETDKDHELTLELMKLVQYDGAYMFKYSPRENTKAWSYKDDVPEHIKLLRLNEIINLQNEISKEKNKKEINKVHEVLAEGQSKRNPQKWQGRTDTNKVVIFDNSIAKISVGELIKIKINDSTSATLFGVPVN